MKTQRRKRVVEEAYCDCGSRLLFRAQRILGISQDETRPQEDFSAMKPIYEHLCLATGKKIELEKKYPLFPLDD